MTNRNILLPVDEIFEKKNKSVEYKITLQKIEKLQLRSRKIAMFRWLII